MVSYQVVNKAYSKNLILCILCILCIVSCLFFAEKVFRICLDYNFIEYPPKPDFDTILYRYSENKELVYEMKPSFSTQEGMFKTNKYGMRDYEYSLTKPFGVIRIAILGDSVSFGKDLMMHQVFDTILEKQLNDNSKVKYEVLNFSVVGYNAYQEEIVLKEKIFKFNPDIVIVASCLDDETYTDGLSELTRQMSPYSIGSRMHSKLISYLLNGYEKKFFKRLSNTDKIKNLCKQLSFLGREEQFESLVLIFPYYFDDINSYPERRQHIRRRKMMEKEGVKTIDLMESWKDMIPEERKLLYHPDDRSHLSAVGMQKIADMLSEYIRYKKG